MKNIFLLFFLIISVQILSAQKQVSAKIDSLKLKLTTCAEDTSKVRILGLLSYQYFRFDTDIGIVYAEQAITLAEKLNWGLGLAFSYNYMGINLGVKGNFPKALIYFNKSFAKYTEIGDKQGIAFSSNNLGNFYRIQKQYLKAIEFFMKAEKINYQLNNKIDLAKNYNNLGLAYSSISDYKKSNEYYYKSLNMTKFINNKELSAQVLINIAENKTKTRNYCEALDLSNQAIKISNELEITYDQAIYNSYVGEIYLKIAEDTLGLEKSCEFYTHNKHANLLAAKKYLLISLDLLAKIHDLDLISLNSQLLSKIYEKLGDPQNALLYYKKYSNNKDSVFSKDNSLKIANIEKKQEVELKDRQIKIQTLEIEKKNAYIVSQIVLFVLLLILLWLVFFFYYRSHQKQKAILVEIEKKKSAEILRKSEEKYRNIFENALEGIFQTTVDGRYLSVNPALAKMYGFETPEEMMTARNDISRDAYFDKNERNHFLKMMEDRGFVKGYEYEVIRKDGQKIWFYEDAQSTKDASGKTMYFDGFVVDITKKKHDEELIKENSREIEMQNYEYKLLNEELRIAKDRAEESDRLKTAFLRNMHHEIRTPMNAIVSFSSFLDNPDLLPEKRNYFTSIIRNSTNQLLTIVMDILTISSLDANQEVVNINKLNINDLVDDLANTFAPQAFNQNLGFAVESPQTSFETEIYTDGEKVMQILTNLLTNALKFTQDGFVEFGYDLVETTGNSKLQFYVKDTGIGIDPSLHTKIFERFRQAELEMTAQFGGTGLGLSISKGLTELLGGELWLESELGKGSIFYFTIPYKTQVG